jgi:hypothetical protein
VKLTAVQKHRIRETVSRILCGAEIEIEHTKSPRLAIEIALAHLLERSDYYERLKAVEGEGT